MFTNVVVNARIHEYIKESSATVLAAVGVTGSDAFRRLLLRIVEGEALPFDPIIPIKKAIYATRTTRCGQLVKVRKDNNLLDVLNEGD